ncbi:hypothetical protein Y1Q_0021216 [Alligator mississippiensis]|uniref:Uncharacterized protein n=1 Tax=Alligator mississippiensis TaxID=8496 RepID=A0A151MS58_ALLMI|nr:hypothetical protein Y1Q_0021216 [Alligator mississippiensis]
MLATCLPYQGPNIEDESFSELRIIQGQISSQQYCCNEISEAMVIYTDLAHGIFDLMVAVYVNVSLLSLSSYIAVGVYVVTFLSEGWL